MRERTDLIEAGIVRLEDEVLPKLAKEYHEKGRHRYWAKFKGKKIPVFHASSANACWRQLCYRYRGDTPQPMDVEGAMRVHDGEPHADSMVYWLNHMGYKVTDEEKFFKKVVKSHGQLFAFAGFIDGIITAPEGPAGKGELTYILEMKGLSTWSMKKDPLEFVNKSYRLQVQMYMWMSGIHRTLFCIKDKNNSKLRLFELPYNADVVKGVLRRCAQVTKAVEDKKLLSKEYDQGSLECSWCLFNNTCRG